MIKKQNIPQDLPSEAKAKRGYKKTKLGWIPEEWEVQKLGNCIKGKPEYGINAAAVEFKKELPVYIRITDISDDGKFLQEKKTSIDNTSSYKYFLQKNDIVFARTGSTTGKTYLYNSKDGELVFAGFLIRVKPNDKKLSAKYLKLYSETHKYWHWVSIMSTRSGQPGINGAEYAQLEIPLPPLPEQQKIAQILSTWDSAIEKYELLIRKYKLRKKGLMQQLLSGKRRFREFEGSEWKAVKLGDNTICFSGGTPSRSKNEYYNGEIPWIKSGELNHEKIYNTEELITNDGLNNSSAKIVEEETILVALYGATAGVVAVTMVEAAINQAVLAILPSKIIDKYFLLYKLKFIMPHVVENMVQGGQPNLSGTIVKGVRINIPVKKNEQQKIAFVISTADKEIEVLNQQLEKLNEQKRGLMQVLLTGKARVKLN